MSRRWKHFDPNELGWTRSEKRDFNKFLKWPAQYEDWFPTSDVDGPIWHDHLPVSWDLLDGDKSSRAVQQVVVETLLGAAETLIRNRPVENSQCRVVALVTLPALQHSSIDVFFEAELVSTFFRRTGYSNSESTYFSQWIPCGDARSLQREWSLVTNLPERGYFSYSRDETFSPPFEEWGEVWALGEID